METQRLASENPARRLLHDAGLKSVQDGDLPTEAVLQLGQRSLHRW